jgi:NAD-dependent deacetylase
MEACVAPGARFTLVTQNIDGLHQRAGSRSVLELHGNGLFSRCMDDRCAGRRPVRDDGAHQAELPRCTVCGGVMRPDVVFFGEQVCVHAAWAAKRALRDCDLFLAIGTSGTVSPAATFVRGAHYAGARTYFVNLESLPEPNPYFHECVIGRAEETLPDLVRL